MRDGVGALRPSFRSGLARLRLGIPAPLQLAGFRIARIEKARNVGHVAGDADQHVILDHQRRHGREVAELGIGQFDVPAQLAVFGVERDQMAIGRFEVQPILVHADAALADVVALRFAEVVPDDAAGARIQRPDVIGRREIQDAVDFERRRFDGRRVQLRHPGQRQLADVRLIDLRQRAVAAAGVIAVVSGPGIGGRLQQRLRDRGRRRRASGDGE